MKILVVCMSYDYGNIARGYSYEYFNFYLSLCDMGYDVQLFDFMTELEKNGQEKMNSDLLSLVQTKKFDLALFSLYTDQFYPKTIQNIGKYTRTLCFFHDDNWRSEYSKFWARYFDFFTTSDFYGTRKYQALGLSNVIFFPWGSNNKLYKKLDMPKLYDVSFVGAWHPYREWIISKIRKTGIKVFAFGSGWPSGIVDHSKMVEIFNSSRINLNLSNSSSWDARYLFSSPRGLWNQMRSAKSAEQLKARHFEINGCGAFQLSFYVDGLEHQYDIGREIAVYLNPDDLLHKIKTYLSDDELRSDIADAGYKRTMECHTFHKRFNQVFERMQLKYD